MIADPDPGFYIIADQDSGPRSRLSMRIEFKMGGKFRYFSVLSVLIYLFEL